MVVLPCGAGKTLVGAAAMAKARATTLILVTNTVAGRQWKRELIARTSLTEEEIGEYSGERKEIRPVTIATYQVMTRKSGGEYRHLDLFDSRDWGLIIYDEVHLLPAPVFRMTADLQSRRRLGLTATLVREDGREGDVFSLIGPKRFDAPWKDIEDQGWIAPAECIEVRVTLTDNERLQYAIAEPEEKYRICSTARTKTPVVRAILERHRSASPPWSSAPIWSSWTSWVKELDAPVIQGSTRNTERERLFDAFRAGEVPVLVVSKVANFSIDLPDATVAVQVSGTFGSRQEEAQRLGRLLRPKADGRQAHFYSVVARDTIDTEYAVSPAAVPRRAGLRVHHRRRRRPARTRTPAHRRGRRTIMSPAEISPERRWVTLAVTRRICPSSRTSGTRTTWTTTNSRAVNSTTTNSARRTTPNSPISEPSRGSSTLVRGRLAEMLRPWSWRPAGHRQRR